MNVKILSFKLTCTFSGESSFCITMETGLIKMIALTNSLIISYFADIILFLKQININTLKSENKRSYTQGNV